MEEDGVEGPEEGVVDLGHFCGHGDGVVGVLCVDFVSIPFFSCGDDFSDRKERCTISRVADGRGIISYGPSTHFEFLAVEAISR